jgi:hypothetical protein
VSPAPRPEWTEDEVLTGRIIFGTKTCPRCGRKLPANSDYFTVDRSRDDGLTGACRRCRAAAGRHYYAENGEARREGQRRYARRVASVASNRAGGMMGNVSGPGDCLHDSPGAMSQHLGKEGDGA